MGRDWAKNGKFLGFPAFSCRDMKGYDVITWLHVALNSVSTGKVMSQHHCMMNLNRKGPDVATSCVDVAT